MSSSPRQFVPSVGARAPPRSGMFHASQARENALEGDRMYIGGGIIGLILLILLILLLTGNL